MAPKINSLVKPGTRIGIRSTNAQEFCLVFLTRDTRDIPIVSELERVLAELGFKVEIVRVPYFWVVTTEKLNKLKAILRKKSSNHFLVFCPDSTELFLDEPDFILAYSAYSGWCNPAKIRVVPHLWGPIRVPENKDDLQWKKKPPLRIGFMGTLHETSRLARMVRIAPKSIKKWLLSGEYLRFPRLRALLNDYIVSTQHISTFPRVEVLNILKHKRLSCFEAELDIVERKHFAGSQQQMDEYVEHLKNNTYILCPRGTENYSYRIYEALSFGRIPVIVDTNVVLPPEINWDRLAVRVPYESINNIYQFIQQDYNQLDETAFLARQQEAFSTIANLQTMSWVRVLANELIERLNHLRIKKNL